MELVVASCVLRLLRRRLSCLLLAHWGVTIVLWAQLPVVLAAVMAIAVHGGHWLVRAVSVMRAHTASQTAARDCAGRAIATVAIQHKAIAAARPLCLPACVPLVLSALLLAVRRVLLGVGVQPSRRRLLQDGHLGAIQRQRTHGALESLGGGRD